MKSIDELKDVYRKLGKNVTPQRIAVWRILKDNPEHPTAETIFEQAKREIGNISIKTVYQILHELEEIGQLSHIQTDSGALRYDPNVEKSHHHLVCTRCRKVTDVYLPASLISEIPTGNLDGFEISDVEIVFRGTCSNCRALKAG